MGNRPPEPRQALLALGAFLRDRGYASVCVSPATHARVLAHKESRWARDLAGAFGWSLPFRSGLLPEDLTELLVEAGLLTPHEGGWRSRVRVSSLDGDLFLHSAYPTQAADAVFFGPDTYRFALAIRTHLATRRLPVREAVDVCCGAGPGAVAVARARPEARVLAFDINEAALLCAEVGCALAGLDRIGIRRGDLLEEAGEGLDLVVANPPYLVDPARRTYRHGGGALGAEVSEALVDQALPRLAAGGTLLLYTGAAITSGVDPFREAVLPRIPDGYHASYHEVDPDVFGEELSRPPYTRADRIAAVVLTVQRVR